jgi:hypothetical protein
MKTKDFGQREHSLSNCQDDMVPPFKFMFSPDPVWQRKGDLYNLNGDVLKLLKARATLPYNRVCDGRTVLTRGANKTLIARKLKNWSLTARFDRNIDLDGTMIKKTCFLYDQHLIFVYNLPHEEQENGEDGRFMVKF